MIESKEELQITKDALVSFQKARENLEKDPIHKSLSAFKQLVHERANEGEIAILSKQIRDFESKQ